MIQAIQTRYKDCLFRSRTEARWAVFFDALKIKWQYEPEGYNFQHHVDGEKQSVNYLPDFYLSDLDSFVEVKGEVPDHDAQIRLMSFSAIVMKPLLCLIGEIDKNKLSCGVALLPTKNSMVTSPCFRFATVPMERALIDVFSTKDYPMFIYPATRNNKGGLDYRFDEEPELRYEPDSCIHLFPKETGYHEFHRNRNAAKKLWKTADFAYTAARSARFEHGETPK